MACIRHLKVPDQYPLVCFVNVHNIRGQSAMNDRHGMRELQRTHDAPQDERAKLVRQPVVDTESPFEAQINSVADYEEPRAIPELDNLVQLHNVRMRSDVQEQCLPQNLITITRNVANADLTSQYVQSSQDRRRV